MSWIMTGVLAFVVGVIVWAEIRCGRRNKIFQAMIDPEIDTLKTNAISKYRERFGKDPTGPYLIVSEPRARDGLEKRS